MLHAEAEEIDARRFEALVRSAPAASDPGAGRARLSGGRERCGAGRRSTISHDQPSLRAEIGRLEALRLAATEERIAAELSLGRHAEVVPELEALTDRYPLREALWDQLMTALYRSGRQADALAAYRRARAVLVGELGLEPGAALRRLEQQVLRQDPALGRAAGRCAGSSCIERMGSGDVRGRPPRACSRRSAVRWR